MLIFSRFILSIIFVRSQVQADQESGHTEIAKHVIGAGFSDFEIRGVPGLVRHSCYWLNGCTSAVKCWLVEINTWNRSRGCYCAQLECYINRVSEGPKKTRARRGCRAVPIHIPPLTPGGTSRPTSVSSHAAFHLPASTIHHQPLLQVNHQKLDLHIFMTTI